MKILLIAATRQEIMPFLNNRLDIEILITGVGSPFTIYELQKKLWKDNYDMVLQAGIAGCFDNKYNLGEVVLVSHDSFGDIGGEEKEIFTTVFDMGLADKNNFPFKKGWLINDNHFLSRSLLNKVKSVTVNKVSDSIYQKQQLLSAFDAQIESMEGAALHYVCLQEKTPFLQIRSISNYVGERNKLKWKMKEAIINLNLELEKIIKEIGNS